MPTLVNQFDKLRPNEVCPCDENGERDKPLKYKKCCMKKVHEQEQQQFEMQYAGKRIAKARKRIAESIQHDIDHPLILPDSMQPGPKIILPDGRKI
jgi:hypothetical protein